MNELKLQPRLTFFSCRTLGTVIPEVQIGNQQKLVLVMGLSSYSNWNIP